MPVTISRSSLEFLRRHGIVGATTNPRPRLDIADLLVHTMPIASPPLPGIGSLLYYAGEPDQPDRGMSRPFPGTTPE